MLHARGIVWFALSALVLTAADQAWKNKQFPEWTEDDAKEVIANSPWVKTVMPTVVKSSEADNQGRTGDRRGGGVNLGGIGIGAPGMGGRGRRGGYPGGDGQRGRSAPSASSPGAIPTLTLRWESALPLREAELKARETGAPTVDEDHYAIAVYGIPRGNVANDSKELADEFKKHATLKRSAKKDLKPSSVDILLREDGAVVVYLFPKSAEITWRDEHLQFDAQIARLKVSQSFDTDDMKFHGNLEL